MQFISALSVLVLSVAAAQAQVFGIVVDNATQLTGQLCELPRSPCHRSNVFCNAEHKCECEMGYIPVPVEVHSDVVLPPHANPRAGHSHFVGKPAFPVSCNMLQCKQNADCARYGSQVTCNDYNQCSCPLSYTYSHEKKGCFTTAVEIGGKCTTSTECGMFAGCDAGECKCNVGFRPKDGNKVACDEQVQCQYDTNCHGWHAECRLGVCNCPEDHVLAKNATLCLPKQQKH